MKAMTTVTTKERPILFSGEMVRAILDGRKTQTRRVIKPQPPLGTQELAMSDCGGYYRDFPAETRDWRCPFQVGMRPWVRETWGTVPLRRRGEPAQQTDEIVYRADEAGLDDELRYVGRWRPSIFMPRWASRITLEVTGVRIERVQDIKRDDALAEGVDLSRELFPGINASDKALGLFPRLWDSINAKRGFGWKENPWVWVVEFRRLTD